MNGGPTLFDTRSQEIKVIMHEHVNLMNEKATWNATCPTKEICLVVSYTLWPKDLNSFS